MFLAVVTVKSLSFSISIMANKFGAGLTLAAFSATALSIYLDLNGCYEPVAKFKSITFLSFVLHLH